MKSAFWRGIIIFNLCANIIIFCTSGETIALHGTWKENKYSSFLPKAIIAMCEVSNHLWAAFWAQQQTDLFLQFLGILKKWSFKIKVKYLFKEILYYNIGLIATFFLLFSGLKEKFQTWISLAPKGSAFQIKDSFAFVRCNIFILIINYYHF